MREFIREFFGQRFTRVAIAVAIVIFLTMGFYPRARIAASSGGVTQSFSNSWIVDLVENDGVRVDTAYYTHPEEVWRDSSRRDSSGPNCSQWPAYCDFVGRRSLVATGFALMGAVVAVGVAEKMLTEDDLDNEEQAAA